MIADPANACPVTTLSESFQLTDRELDSLYQRALAESPVTYLPDIGYWAITRYTDIKSIMHDRDRFSSAITLEPVQMPAPEVQQYLRDNNFNPQPILVPNDDPDNHARVRKQTQLAFSPRALKAVEPKIRQLVDDTIDKFIDDSPTDLVESMFYELPAIVLFMVMGIPDEDVQNVKRWADNRLLFLFGRLSVEQQLLAAKELVDYWHYSIEHVTKKAVEPGDDLPSSMLEARKGDEGALSENEIANVVFGLLLAGHETTTNMSSNAVLALLRHPHAWTRLVHDPGAIPNAIEELLRFRPSVIAWRRRTKAPVEISGVKIPADQKLLLVLGAANRDGETFENPEELDIDRANSRSHIAFGFGPHFCLGAPLARLELRIILEQLTTRLPALRLADRPEAKVIETICFRGPKELWVAW